MYGLISIISGYQAAVSGSSILLPLWFFWLLVGLVGALVIILLIRDKALRHGLKNIFSSLRRRVKRTKLEGRIRKETKEKEGALTELGQKAWEIGAKSDATVGIDKDIKALEQKREDNLKEAVVIDSESEKLQSAHQNYKKDVEEKIKLQEEKKSPHAEHLSQTKESLKRNEADLSHVEKEIRAADKEKADAEKEITKTEQNTALSEEMKQTKIAELNARIFELTKKKEELESKRPALEEQKSRLLQQKEDDQNRVKEFDQTISSFREEEKERQKVFDKEMKQWQKKKDVLVDKNKEIDNQKQPLFFRLGKALYEKRVESPDLEDIYTRIEEIEKTVREYEEKRRELEKSSTPSS
jgi:chromosome segregation ATPase